MNESDSPPPPGEEPPSAEEETSTSHRGGSGSRGGDSREVVGTNRSIRHTDFCSPTLSRQGSKPWNRRKSWWSSRQRSNRKRWSCRFRWFAGVVIRHLLRTTVTALGTATTTLKIVVVAVHVVVCGVHGLPAAVIIATSPEEEPVQLLPSTPARTERHQQSDQRTSRRHVIIDH